MRRMTVLLLVFVTLASGALACGQESTPTPGATPTPFPLYAADWAGITVHTLCLEVEQSYPEIEGKRPEPIAEEARRILAGIGVQVVDEGASCDATLMITLTGEALGADYQLRGHCYSGAEVNGQVALTSPGHAPLSFPISGRESPPYRITDCPGPHDAPFLVAWLDALLDGLACVWGPQVLMQTVQLVEIYPGDGLLRSAAAGAMGRMGPEAKEAIPVLVEALADEDISVSGAAADALGQMGPEAVAGLVQALGSEDWFERSVAADALGDIGPEAKEAVPALARMLRDDENASVRKAAAKALGRIGTEVGHAVPALVQALGDESETVREEAARALGRIGPEAGEGVPALIQALEDEVLAVRRTAAWALGNIRPEPGEAVPALIQALGDEEWQVRKAAAEALAAITGQDLGEDAAGWQEWWEKQQ